MIKVSSIVTAIAGVDKEYKVLKIDGNVATIENTQTHELEIAPLFGLRLIEKE